MVKRGYYNQSLQKNHQMILTSRLWFVAACPKMSAEFYPVMKFSEKMV